MKKMLVVFITFCLLPICAYSETVQFSKKIPLQ